MAERLQYDAHDAEGNPVRLVFERIDESNENSTISTVLYWPDNVNTVQMVFEKAKVAKDVYQGIKTARCKIIAQEPEGSVTIEEG